VLIFMVDVIADIHPLDEEFATLLHRSKNKWYSV
jgi:hypothetical protein